MIDLVEAVYRGWDWHHPVGHNLWFWHSMMEEYGYAVIGSDPDFTTTTIAERGFGPWDKIVLSEHIWIS